MGEYITTGNRVWKMDKKKPIFTLMILSLMLLPIGSIMLAGESNILPPLSTGAIVDSERFTNVLKEENVDAWIYGHIHSEHSMEKVQVEKWGTKFIEDGSINEKPESLLLIFEKGEEFVKVKSRDHSEGEWNNLDKFSFRLKYPFTWDKGKENLRVWVWSDSQPTNERDWERLESAIEDADENIRPDISLVPGDLVDHGAEEEFRKIKKYLDNSELPLENFFETAGNHEFEPYFTGDHSNYQKYIENDLIYNMNIGNLLFIFMRDERPGTPGNIGDETFQWWEGLVKNNQENFNIITLSHHPPAKTTRGSYGKASVLDLWNAEISFLVYFLIVVIALSPAIAYEVS